MPLYLVSDIVNTHLFQATSIKENIDDLGFQVDEFPEQDIAVCRLRIKGMACTSCSESIERALLVVDGVKKAVVGLAIEEAKIHFDPNTTDSDHLIQAIEDAGFKADLISSGDDVDKVHLILEGLSSPDEAIHIQSVLESVEGVNLVKMDVSGHKATITYDNDLTGPRSLIQCVKEAGGGPNFYNASLYTPPRRRESERQHEIEVYRDKFLWSCLFSVPVFLFSMVLPMIPSCGKWLSIKVYNMLTLGMLLRWLLCTPVQFIIGHRYVIAYVVIIILIIVEVFFFFCLQLLLTWNRNSLFRNTISLPWKILRLVHFYPSWCVCV